MKDNELIQQSISITAILKQPEQGVEETDEDFRMRWALNLQNSITMGSHLVAAALWQLHHHGLYVYLGHKNIRSFMASEAFPFSPGYGAKMIAAIDRYQKDLGADKVVGLLDELGVNRMYAVSSEEFDVQKVDDDVEFIHADSGTVIKASELKDIGARETSETLKRLRRENATHRDNVDMLENEVEELKTQIRDADLHGRSPLELQKQLREKDLEIAQLRKQKLDDATLQNEIDKAVRNVRKFAGTLDEMLGETLSKDIELELHREVSSLFGIFNRMLKKVEAITIH